MTDEVGESSPSELLALSIADAISDAGAAIQLRIHVATSKGRSRIKGVSSRGIELDVAAPPLEGRANREVVTVICKELGLKPAQVEVIHGDHSRSKVLRIVNVGRSQIEDALKASLER